MVSGLLAFTKEIGAAPEPGADHSFGQLQLVFAPGDFESLGPRRRPVIRLHLTGGARQGLAQLEIVLNQVLGMKRIVTP
jgi:hypothetical protein